MCCVVRLVLGYMGGYGWGVLLVVRLDKKKQPRLAAAFGWLVGCCGWLVAVG